MKIFSLDTSSERIIMGYVDESKGISADFNLIPEEKHSTLLLDLIDSFLKSLNVRIEEIDLLGCGMGPGFFTALRIGIAVIKLFAFVFRKKILGIPSPDAVALNLPVDGKIMVILYARKDHFYVSLYEKKDGELNLLLPHSFQDRKSLMHELKKLSEKDERIFVSGDGIPHVEILKEYENFTILDENAWYINGRNLNELALKYYRGGKNLYDALSFLPQYVQKPFVILKKEEEMEGKR